MIDETFLAGTVDQAVVAKVFAGNVSVDHSVIFKSDRRIGITRVMKRAMKNTSFVCPFYSAFVKYR